MSLFPASEALAGEITIHEHDDEHDDNGHDGHHDCGDTGGCMLVW